MTPQSDEIKKIPEEFGEVVGSELLKSKLTPMNQVNYTDVSWLTIALASFTSISVFLNKGDYVASVIALVAGVVSAFCYHIFGSQSTK